MSGPLVGWYLFAGCGQSPTTHDDCLTLRDAATRDACHVELLASTFRVDPQRAFAEMETYVKTLQLRDYLLLQATLETTTVWCPQMTTPVLAARCEAYLSRPHLYDVEVLGPDAAR